MKALYSLYDALVAISVPTDKARAVVDAMEEDMSTHLATKSDVISLRTELKQESTALRNELKQESTALRNELKQEINALRNELKQEISALGLQMELLQSKMTVRLGSIAVVLAGLLFTALKLT